MEARRLLVRGAIGVGIILLILWVVGTYVIDMRGLVFDRGTGDLLAQGNSAETPRKTDAVLKGLLSAYKDVAASSQERTPEEIQELLRKSIADSIQKNVTPADIPTITAAHLRVAPNTSEAQFTYTRGISNLLHTHYHPSLSQELSAFNTVFNQNADAAYQKKVRDALLRSRTSYEKIATGMSQLPVPQSEVSRTVLLVNAYYALSVGSGLLAEAINDPILALQGLQAYGQGYLALKNL